MNFIKQLRKTTKKALKEKMRASTKPRMEDLSATEKQIGVNLARVMEASAKAGYGGIRLTAGMNFHLLQKLSNEKWALLFPGLKHEIKTIKNSHGFQITVCDLEWSKGGATDRGEY